MAVISMKNLLESGTHFGHTTPKWHPKMKPYIYGKKAGIHIVDLRLTLRKLKEAYNYVSSVSARGGKILFVGTKLQARDAIKSEAIRSGNFYVNHRWLGGFLTNFDTIRQSLNRLSELEGLAGEDGNYPGIIKKEATRLEKQRVKIEAVLGGVKDMRKMPALIFILDVDKEHTALKEANKLKIPIVAVVDTNTNPESVNYPIPGNDDSLRSIELFVSVIASASISGREIFEQQAKVRREEKKIKKLVEDPDKKNLDIQAKSVTEDLPDKKTVSSTTESIKK